jgi:hypothetical protein
MKNILTNWKTTLIGLIIAGGLAYKAFTTGFSIEDAVFGLIAVGFLTSKDGDKSHTKDFTADTGGHPDPEKEEK